MSRESFQSLKSPKNKAGSRGCNGIIVLGVLLSQIHVMQTLFDKNIPWTTEVPRQIASACHYNNAKEEAKAKHRFNLSGPTVN